MPQKIKILRLEKTEQYLATEIAVVKAEIAAMLAKTDWTQLPDSGLSTVCQLRFRIWRNSLRNLKVEDPNVARFEMQCFKDSMPELVKISSNYAFVTTNFNFSNELTLISSCNKILSDLGIEQSISFSEQHSIVDQFFMVLEQNGY